MALRGVEFEAPEGMVKIDPVNNHTWKIVQIGAVNSEGQFDILWSTGEPVRPDPYPELISPDEDVVEPGVMGPAGSP